MTRSRRLAVLFSSALICLLSVSCGAAQPERTATTAPEPTARPLPTPREFEADLLHVALGDSEALSCGLHSYPEYFAEHIEEDLGIKVDLLNLAGAGETSEEFLKMLGGEYYRAVISQARIVTVVITMKDLLRARPAVRGGDPCPCQCRRHGGPHPNLRQSVRQ